MPFNGIVGYEIGNECTEHHGTCDDNFKKIGGGGVVKPTTVPPCVPKTFVGAFIVPSTLRPNDFVSVYCDYGARLSDGLTVTSAGLVNCRYSRYEGANNIFSCQAGPNEGLYTDVMCALTPKTKDNVCKGENKAGNITILGTEVNFDQDVILMCKTNYTLSAKVKSVIAKGKGVLVQLICNSDVCTPSIKKNAVVKSISFPAQADNVSTKAIFKEIKSTFQIPCTGDDKHYLVRISADKGSEAYFDAVSLEDAKGHEFITNGEFIDMTSKTVSTSQPADWGEGDNKIGYYYGSLGAGAPAPTAVPPPGPTAGGPTAVPPTGGATGPVSLALKIKFQGISKKPTNANPINVQVKIDGGTLPAATAYKTVSFSVNDAGEWSGTAAFDAVPAGSGYKVYIKGPKHLSKKICDAAPSEATSGTYHCTDGKIALVAGTNTFDLSKIVLLAGDLPEAGGAQNGIIDAYDTTFIRTNLGTTDAAKIAIGDLNLDGGIDTQDYSMILQSLSIKFDEQ